MTLSLSPLSIWLEFSSESAMHPQRRHVTHFFAFIARSCTITILKIIISACETWDPAIAASVETTSASHLVEILLAAAAETTNTWVLSKAALCGLMCVHDWHPTEATFTLICFRFKTHNFATFTPSIHTSPWHFETLLKPFSVLKFQGCILVWTGRNSNFWKQSHRYLCFFFLIGSYHFQKKTGEKNSV